MDFFHLRKTGKIYAIIYGKKLLDSVKKSTTVALKLFQKEQFKKQQMQLVI